jgi:hypothetical protein
VVIGESMRLKGRYILTTNDFKLLFKCNKILERHETSEGIDYYISARVYRHSNSYVNVEGKLRGENRNLYLFLDKNGKPLDWIFLTRDEFLVELL